MAATHTIWTIGALLTWTNEFFTRQKIDDPRLSAELLLSHILGCSRMALYTQYERVPDESQLTAYRAAVKQAAAHTPVAYLIGKAWFFSLEFRVTPDVLIPRPDTETLVEQVIQRVRQTPGWETPSILDLCTGSGCVAIALAKNLPTASIVAADISAAALDIARHNAQALGVAERITFAESDLTSAVRELNPPRKFHVIASNPPYIATHDIEKLAPAVRDHEPRRALDGGPDGLDFHRRILNEARELLHPGGLVAVEIAFNQSPAVTELFTQAGYLETPRQVRDAAGQPRCVLATAVEAK